VKRLLLCTSLLLLAGSTLTYAALRPQQVIVVYNSHAWWSPISKAVADYYCAARDIPESNEIGLSVPRSDEVMGPSEFVTYILNDQGSNPGLRTFLSSRPGFDIDDPGSDPTMCIVLCYGIPLRIQGGGYTCSVDSALTLLFNPGPEPYTTGGLVTNPYFCAGSPTDPLDRDGKPADFGEFRESTYNSISVPGYTWKMRYLVCDQRDLSLA